ncbi:MAG TPA: TauD/TfdA family dioxygenase [Acidimicrobiales bacterium]|nr:TauD/TfdA family dioxygenase [Acidimicrobiales bacterium]
MASTAPLAQRVRLRFDVEAGPLGHLQAERERLASLAWEHFEPVLLGATIGAELHGIRLGADLPDEVIAEIRQALLEYKVVFFRDQDQLTPADHVAFARRFGELEVHPFLEENSEHPELVRFEKSPEIGGYENGWHSDVSWREVPSMGAILRALEIPPSGGDTLFCDMYAAYEGLDDELRDQIDDLVAVHDYTQVFGLVIPPEKKAEMRATYPPVEHPVVRTHRETGRRLLYVNRFFVHHIVGLDQDESDRLVDRLSRRAEIVEYQCRFRWAPHSVAFWDNRAVQHYAASDYWPARRVMERASIIGDRPR